MHVCGVQLASTVEDDESLERLLIQLLCNLSGFKNNQQKLGACVRACCESFRSAQIFFVLRSHDCWVCAYGRMCLTLYLRMR